MLFDPKSLFATVVLVAISAGCEPVPDPSGGSGSSEGGVPAGCENCEVALECTAAFLTEQQCIDDCVDGLDGAAEVGPACTAAHGVLNDCLTPLNCPDYEEFAAPTQADYPCESEYADQVLHCTFDGQLSPECVAFCDNSVLCSDPPTHDRPFCLALCGKQQNTAAQIGLACKDATNAQLACVGALACDNYQAWAAAAGVGGNYPCATEDQTVGGAC